jgi:hypothetical protein
VYQEKQDSKYYVIPVLKFSDSTILDCITLLGENIHTITKKSIKIPLEDSNEVDIETNIGKI